MDYRELFISADGLVEFFGWALIGKPFHEEGFVCFAYIFGDPHHTVEISCQ